jgi:RNA polymerase sigma-70 factor (sigma-E family)
MMSTRDVEFRSYVLERRVAMVQTATLLTAGDRHLAEDVVQATLTRLYVAWPRFSRAQNRDAYAHRALLNALADEYRRPWRRRERSWIEVQDRADPLPGPGGGSSDRLHDALRELPPRMRSTVVCRYFLDLSVADTAAALSCSQGNVKSQTARALDRLRGLLDGPTSDPAVTSDVLVRSALAPSLPSTPTTPTTPTTTRSSHV